ncbi:outer membrane lipoprotein chaperone LolA [Marinobacter caseinilyticus]|uniref:outer membrane lipoprotein chaperone LolA n=1 Tax=Marinobacter caseinilyticus TaxID=2692195 RepID=UPI001F3B49D6|nr:outer membrane lipoprotein chaperone LolA [Marinobacter caseinilyticus]
MVRNRIWMFLLSWVLGVSAVVAAEGASTDGDAAEQLANELREYRTFQASFIQIVVDASGNDVQETRGTLKAKRPGLFYWETRQPMAQFIASNNEQVEVYDPDLEQVTIHALDQQAANTPAMLLSGDVSNLSKNYDVSSQKLDTNATAFTLVPKNPDSLFVSLRMKFYNGKLEEMRLEDSLGQRSILSFTDIELNSPLSDNAFVLSYPEGVDVIKGGS